MTKRDVIKNFMHDERCFIVFMRTSGSPDGAPVLDAVMAAKNLEPSMEMRMRLNPDIRGKVMLMPEGTTTERLIEALGQLTVAERVKLYGKMHT